MSNPQIDCCGHERAISMANERADRWRRRYDDMVEIVKELAEEQNG